MILILQRGFGFLQLFSPVQQELIAMSPMQLFNQPALLIISFF